MTSVQRFERAIEIECAKLGTGHVIAKRVGTEEISKRLTGMEKSIQDLAERIAADAEELSEFSADAIARIELMERETAGARYIYRASPIDPVQAARKEREDEKLAALKAEIEWLIQEQRNFYLGGFLFPNDRVVRLREAQSEYFKRLAEQTTATG